MNYRLFVEKRPEYQVEVQSLQNELNSNLNLDLQSLRLVNIYDLFDFTPELLESSRYQVFGEVVTDCVSTALDLGGHPHLAIEFLPGQFDQRAASAVDCVKLIAPNADIVIKSAKLLIFDADFPAQAIDKVKKYVINAVESREKDLSVLAAFEHADVKPVPTLSGFRTMENDDLAAYCKANGLAMNADDLQCVVDYFKAEGRDPSETELRILDTYWSDHCRHTTFTTVLDDITIEPSFLAGELQAALDHYLAIRRELGREQKPLCLMDIATIGGRYLRAQGFLDDLEVSEENNACSIFIDVVVDDKPEKWLLQFKNETHNHPTEIEPFGGASTCLGGAIRDPLSGRSYVYQAMRVTGAGNIYAPVADTIEGKLPQRIISTKAAHGYSSYGNQIGLATTHVREIYHDDYVAKRLEVGAVVGAVKAEDVRRESPVAGDVVLMFGGRTGRDGIGGATGSSKEHTTASLETCSSEVQKGNAPEERKIERLFRRPEVTRLIKKSNDFGAGGVSVAIGELTDGLDIYLDRVRTKYSGLNATELAISESQERMSVVVEAKDAEAFAAYCAEENIEIVHVADVTDTNRLRMFYKGETVVDMARSFIDSAGAAHHTKATIGSVEERNPFRRKVEGYSLEERITNNLKHKNVLSQRGLIEMFDATIGASTVLMPFGGATQRTETQVSVQKLPVKNGFTNTSSIMAYGYNPDITSWSPYHGAAYAVVEACAKVVAAGARYDKMRFSYQEYFERMTAERSSWGKPLAALLGALKMQTALKLPAIGGKDSMSGTFNQINVPPMLMAFGITTVEAPVVISPEFKAAGHYIYLVDHKALDNHMPDTELLKANFSFVSEEIESGVITSAYAVGFGGVAEALCKMSFGNNIGVEATIAENDLFDYRYGSIVVVANKELAYPTAHFLGKTTAQPSIVVNGAAIAIETLYEANTKQFTTVYPDKSKGQAPLIASETKHNEPTYNGPIIERPIAYLPVFPGTNCDYDTAKAFRRAGAEVTSTVFCNLTGDDITRSIEAMKQHIAACHILVFSGGFSAGDEPDGSGKFIANVLNSKEVADEIHRLIDRGGLILGICNGFQALVKSGLLPYGRLGTVTTDSPTLFRNDINRHISLMASTRVASTASPWLRGFTVGETHAIAMSHGEGKFVVSEAMAKELFANNQVAFQYVDAEGKAATQSPFNPNGSAYAIEGIISRNGQILGKMGHSERYEDQLFKNITGNKRQDIFGNAVRWFQGK